MKKSSLNHLFLPKYKEKVGQFSISSNFYLYISNYSFAINSSITFKSFIKRKNYNSKYIM